MDRIIVATGATSVVHDLAYRHGRHEVSLVPGFCGRPGVALGAKAPDTVTFLCSRPPAPGAVLTLVLASGFRRTILVTGRRGERVVARVVDGPPGGRAARRGA